MDKDKSIDILFKQKNKITTHKLLMIQTLIIIFIIDCTFLSVWIKFLFFIRIILKLSIEIKAWKKGGYRDIPKFFFVPRPLQLPTVCILLLFYENNGDHFRLPSSLIHPVHIVDFVQPTPLPLYPYPYHPSWLPKNVLSVLLSKRYYMISSTKLKSFYHSFVDKYGGATWPSMMIV